jgi:Nickel responsive protein SCO4226-like
MPNYLVEVYLPRSRAHEARDTGDRARTAAEQLAHGGEPIRYLRTTYLPDDETCFHLFEASTPAAVEEASRRAGLGPVRIVTAIEASQPPCPRQE